MNRNERRARSRQQTKTAATLRKRATQTQDAKAALEIAQRFFQLGRSEQALPGLRVAVGSHPGDPDLRAALAYASASTGHIAAAIDEYRAVLGLAPESAPVLTNLAILLAKTGNLDDARLHLYRAAAIAPDHANTVFTLAELLGKQKRNEEAFHQYLRAAALLRQKIGKSPEIRHCDDLIKLATAQMWTGEIEPGLRSLDLAIEMRPDHALALTRRGLALVKLRRIPEGLASLKRAAAVVPDFAGLRRTLGEVLRDAGEFDAAQKQYEVALRLDPTDELARYFLAAVTHKSPDAPPPVYVEKLFDEYAQTFERHLIGILQYRVPELLCGAVLELAGSAAAGWQVIDLGCGTGLCGPLIRHAAARLVGVDLSGGMLDEARAKGVYDELVLGDVAQVLATYTAQFDLALVADVMVYLGDLAPTFAAAARALKPGALFACTTEIHVGEGFVLDVSGRYLHSRAYMEKEAASNGFSIAHVESIVARYQNHEPVVQNLFIARRESEYSDEPTVG